MSVCLFLRLSAYRPKNRHTDTTDTIGNKTGREQKLPENANLLALYEAKRGSQSEA